MPQACPGAVGATDVENNYRKAMELGVSTFLGFDQKPMVENLPVEADEGYLYVRYVGERYRVGRATGVVERLVASDAAGTWQQSSPMEAFPIWDYLCDSIPGATPAGSFTKQPNTTFRARYTYDSELMPQETKTMNEHLPKLAQACAALGALDEKGPGDVNARFEIFPGIWFLFRFWEGDEEFDPCFKFVWDENILDFIKFETCYYVHDHVVRRLLALMQV